MSTKIEFNNFKAFGSRTDAILYKKTKKVNHNAKNVYI